MDAQKVPQEEMDLPGIVEERPPTSREAGQKQWKLAALKVTTLGYVTSRKSYGMGEDALKLLHKSMESTYIDLKTTTNALNERLLNKQGIFRGFRYLVVLFTFFTLVSLQTDVSTVNSLEHTLSSYFTGSGDYYAEEIDKYVRPFTGLQTFDDVFLWLKYPFTDLLLPAERSYNGAALSDDEQGYLLTFNKLVGGFRIVQQRVDNIDSGCASKRFQGYYPSCSPAFSHSKRSRTPFGPNYDPEKYFFSGSAFSGGFKVDLPNDREMATNIIDELRHDLFLTRNTRQLNILFIVYNGNLEMFSQVNLGISFFNTGKLTTEVQLQTFRLEYYLTFLDFFRLVIEIVWYIYATGVVICEACEMREKGVLGYLRVFWNWIDLARCITYVAMFVVWIVINTHEENLNLDLPLEGKEFYSLNYSGALFSFYVQLCTINVLLCLFKGLEFMGYTKSYGILVQTIKHAGGPLIRFLVIWVVTICCFAVMGMVTFGSRLEEWADMWTSIETLHMMVTGEYGYAPLTDVSAAYAAIFYLLYLVLVFFLLVNILLAIMMESYVACVDTRKNEQVNKTHNITVPLMREFYNETVQSFATNGFVSGFISKHWLDSFNNTAYLGTEDLIELLDPDRHPGLLTNCRTHTPPATLEDPSPPPEFFLTFLGLTECMPKSHAEFIMACFGCQKHESEFDL
ncbi:hypothetical protein CYMTET_51305 [Cymbomonas tetramitiformis]|uniref:Uncharacterized protein n=1 Tax=Cymbomonas tetramitiformis TaxID=36881 RepID=A0AAE0BMI6_9CHLO|nr:hypothetical protein CYMTET_51305 [Cymbomonas tetramitiformis]